MKILIVSDIHGSAYFAKKIPEILENEKAEKLVLLGDLYYHGPRNPFPKDYAPMEVAEVLNNLKEKLKDNFIAIKGNCDAEVDEMISNFEFKEHYVEKINNKIMYFTHGHKNNIDKLPDEKIDIMYYGHFHTGFIKEKDGIIFANPGSMSLPKENTPNSYLLVDENEIILKDIDGNVINRKNF